MIQLQRFSSWQLRPNPKNLTARRKPLAAAGQENSHDCRFSHGGLWDLRSPINPLDWEVGFRTRNLLGQLPSQRVNERPTLGRTLPQVETLATNSSLTFGGLSVLDAVGARHKDLIGIAGNCIQVRDQGRECDARGDLWVTVSTSGIYPQSTH